MKLFKISQDINDDYDTYDSAVVAAESEEDARTVHPSSYVTHYRDGKWYGTYSGGDSVGQEYENENDGSAWVANYAINKVQVEYLGEAKDGTEKGVIVASFNAG